MKAILIEIKKGTIQKIEEFELQDFPEANDVLTETAKRLLTNGADSVSCWYWKKKNGWRPAWDAEPASIKFTDRGWSS